MMKRLLFTLLIIASAAVTVQAKNPKVKLGIEVLAERNFDILKGKRVGLITNATAVDKDLNSTIDILHQAAGVKLVALYGPEHGVRGDVHAGDKVENMTDDKTGVIVYSIYGSARKPTPEMLKDIDVLVYDIQDIGCRSYTFISTMGLAMEAAGELGIEVVVLDRPNPLGGNKVEGCLTEDKYISFVSQFKIPYLYGLTYGELAIMLNKEKMLSHQCQLTVIPMEGWKRKMLWEDTGLNWVPTSPHIPNSQAAYLYPATGILGELGYISIGVGYTLPFQMIGAPWIEAEKLANALQKHNLPGVTFKALHFKPFYSTFKGENCQGVQIYITDFEASNLSALQFVIMDELARMYPDHATFDHANKNRYNMFDKVSGSNYIRETFSKEHKWSDIEAYWNKDVESFKKLSSKYYLYK